MPQAARQIISRSSKLWEKEAEVKRAKSSGKKKTRQAPANPIPPSHKTNRRLMKKTKVMVPTTRAGKAMREAVSKMPTTFKTMLRPYQTLAFLVPALTKR